MGKWHHPVEFSFFAVSMYLKLKKTPIKDIYCFYPQDQNLWFWWKSITKKMCQGSLKDGDYVYSTLNGQSRKWQWNLKIHQKIRTFPKNYAICMNTAKNICKNTKMCGRCVKVIHNNAHWSYKHFLCHGKTLQMMVLSRPHR